MTKQDLVKRYEFLQNPVAKTPYAMYGIECDEGWVPLLDELFSRIDVIVRREGLTNFTVIQVKEKFGALRVYVSGANHEIYALIEEAGRRSEATCERCGRPGRIRKVRGRMVTLCEPDYVDEKRRLDDEDQ